jgi:hypothetical protein
MRDGIRTHTIHPAFLQALSQFNDVVLFHEGYSRLGIGIALRCGREV